MRTSKSDDKEIESESYQSKKAYHKDKAIHDECKSFLWLSLLLLLLLLCIQSSLSNSNISIFFCSLPAIFHLLLTAVSQIQMAMETTTATNQRFWQINDNHYNDNNNHYLGNNHKN